LYSLKSIQYYTIEIKNEIPGKKIKKLIFHSFYTIIPWWFKNHRCTFIGEGPVWLKKKGGFSCKKYRRILAKKTKK
jgi:hypothetical protein